MTAAPFLFFALLSALTLTERLALVFLTAAALGVGLGWLFGHVGFVPRRWPNERCGRR